MLILMAGLPATGKSAMAQQLALELPAVVLDKDRIRAALFPPSEIEYSVAQDDFCMRVMLQTAECLLRQDPDRHVILDGRPFSRRYQVHEVMQAAARWAVPLRIIECICSDETAKARLARDQDQHLAANRDFDLYLSIKARFEPIEAPKWVVHTDEDLSSCVASCLAYLRSPMPTDHHFSDRTVKR